MILAVTCNLYELFYVELPVKRLLSAFNPQSRPSCLYARTATGTYAGLNREFGAPHQDDT